MLLLDQWTRKFQWGTEDILSQVLGAGNWMHPYQIVV